MHIYLAPHLAGSSATWTPLRQTASTIVPFWDAPSIARSSRCCEHSRRCSLSNNPELVILTSLYGITSIQTVYYFEHFPNDRNKSKALVRSPCCLDEIRLICALGCWPVVWFTDSSNFSKTPLWLVLSWGYWSLRRLCWMAIRCTCISSYTMVISMQLTLTFGSSRNIVSSNVSDICDNRSASVS